MKEETPLENFKRKLPFISDTMLGWICDPVNSVYFPESDKWTVTALAAIEKANRISKLFTNE